MRNYRAHWRIVTTTFAVILCVVLFPTLKALADGPEYTTEKILQLIEANEGPEGLDLSGKNLSKIDLSREMIQAELERVRRYEGKTEPVWLSKNTGGINLWRANLQYAKLWDADLRGADLEKANLQEANLWRADLREAALWGANLRGANLSEANLLHVNLLDCDSLTGIHFYRATLDHTQLTQEQIGEAVGEERYRIYDEAQETYRALKVNFVHIGRYQDAAWAYIKERKMERATLWPFRAAEHYAGEEWWSKASRWQRGWFYLVCFTKWVWAGLIDAITGYGQQISNVLGTSAIIITVWSALYWFFGGIGENHKPRSVCWQDFHRCLNHSVATFANLTYSSLEPKTQVAQWLTNTEALLGIGMLALLMFVIGNRVGGI